MASEPVVRVGAAVLQAIADHARAECPRECCGLLIGCDGRIAEAVATANVAATPTRHYEISPADYLAQINRCRMLSAREGRAYSVVGAYHSHPRSAPEPSPTDLDQSFQDFLYVIAGPAEAHDIEIKAYRLSHQGLEPVPLVVD